MSLVKKYILKNALIQSLIHGMFCAYNNIIISYIIKNFINYSLPDTGITSIILSTQSPARYLNILFCEGEV